MITQGYDDKTAFDYFIQNSEISLLTNSSLYGTIFKADINSGIISPYKSSRFNSASSSSSANANTVNSIIIKLCFIGKSRNSLKLTYTNDAGFPDTKNKEMMKINEFLNEIEIQNSLTIKTLEYLDPICPFLIYGNVDKDFIDKRLTFPEPPFSFQILNNIHQKSNPSTKKLIETIDTAIQNYSAKMKTMHLGIVAMEFVQSTILNTKVNKYFNSLTSNLKMNNFIQKDYIKQKCICILELINMTLLGYNHGDFHLGNIMIDTDYEGYFSNPEKGKCYIIDFGRTEKLTQTEYNAYTKLYTNFFLIQPNNLIGTTTKKLQYFKLMYFILSMSLDLLNNINSHYGWVFGNINDDYPHNYSFYENETAWYDTKSSTVMDKKLITFQRITTDNDEYPLIVNELLRLHASREKRKTETQTLNQNDIDEIPVYLTNTQQEKRTTRRKIENTGGKTPVSTTLKLKSLKSHHNNNKKQTTHKNKMNTTTNSKPKSIEQTKPKSIEQTQISAITVQDQAKIDWMIQTKQRIIENNKRWITNIKTEIQNKNK